MRPARAGTTGFPHLAMLLSLWLGGATAAVLAVEPTQRDIEYARVAGRSLRLDFYRPAEAGSTPHPLVVWVHGGAWRAGSKADVPVTRWLETGRFALASVDYRLSPEARFPAQIHDIKAAIRFMRQRAQEYAIVPDRVIIAGSSAGGHLAALVGVSNGVAELEGTVGDNLRTSSNVQAIVSFYGASNLQTILSQSTDYGLSVRVPALQLLLGGQPDEQPALARLASPVAHVDDRDPPLWLIHGDADPQMPAAQSAELSAAYRRLQLPVDYEVIAGGRHGGPAFFEPARLDRLANALNRTRTVGPTDTHLKDRQP